MCIVCKMREAGASEEALELAAALADFAVTVANGLARLKTEQGALLTAEEESALLSGRALFEGDDKDEAAPEGVPGEVWAAASPPVRDLIRAAHKVRACKLCRFRILWATHPLPNIKRGRRRYAAFN